MKRVFFLLAAIIMTATCAVAQSFTVVDGGVTWRYNVSDVGTNPMPFGDGTLTIAGHTYTLGSGLKVTVSRADAAIEPLIVDVCFAGTETTVEAPGALADRLTISVTGGNVDITAAPSLAQEITYNLHGTGESFALHGDYKATVVLDNVDLTANGTTPALWVDCGKRIDFVVTDKSKNTFKDSAANEKKTLSKSPVPCLQLISATPSTAQFVVMSGRKMPRAAWSGGRKRFIAMSMNCTSAAITRMNASVWM